MGKLEGQAGIVVEEPPAPDLLPCGCTKSTFRWLVSVVLGLYVLAFALWSIFFHASSSSDSLAPSSEPWMPYIEASFRLRMPVTAINESLQILQVDLQDEIGIPDTQIDIISMVPLLLTNWTEVRFTVSPDRSNDSIAPAEMSLLKDTFVELFMERAANLSLTDEIFGRVSHFEVLRFPGGITVVPEQAGFPLSKVLVLFNFTLHNSLSHITCNFAEFRKQLATGIILKPNESLFVQLTNLEGSTLNPPLVVQTSILPVVGIMLPTLRLKQLAQEIIASPRRNLGLNHSLFGKVKKVELSSYLQYSLDPAQTPSPSPSPGPSFSPDWPPNPCNSRRRRGSRVDQSHTPTMAPLPSFHRARAPASEGLAAAPHHHLHRHHHHEAFGLAPRSSASPPSPYLSPTTSSYPQPQHSSGYRAPTKSPSPSISTTAPGSVSGPLESYERIAFVPAASPTSSAIILGIPTWGVAVLLALLVGSFGQILSI